MNRRPDYALFASGDEKEAAEELKESPELWDHAAAVADAKRWELDLDSRRAGETPSAQISNYLYRSGVRWGILTNGRKWRLYEQDRARTGDTYYEVDLVDLLNSENLVAFRYFYLFFRRDGFVPIRDDKSFVDLVFEGSERYRTDVGEDLKDAVYDALRWLMNGFFAYPDNDLDPSRPGDLQDVHDLSLIVLYRLLFLLYAEDRDVLPVREQPYKDYSLLRLQREINTRLREGQPQATNASGIWSRFLDTCALIDNGLHNGDGWIIPAYNGGLFSPERYPEIAHEPCGDTGRWRIGDHYLARAIDLVAYQRERWDRPGADDVDYATLDVQHLGSIYEGLLELQPRIAEEPMVEQPGKSGKPPTVEPEAEIDEPKKVRGAPPRRFEAGEIYLITDRGERKATGSYYTPKYIVDYIVEHTVGELAQEAADEVENRWEAARDEHNWKEPDDLHAAIAEIGDTIDDLKKEHEDAAGDVQVREEIAQKLKAAGKEKEGLEEIRRSLLEPYLDFKILDPAMGSGHFLVGAADYLSLAMATDPNLPLHANEGTKPQVHYKQLVVQHCLYGVDLNPLAVELAKLSLWLHTVSQDKALSFLDHHLRCGNSLIGARIEEDLSKPPPAVGGGEQNAEGEGAQLSFRLDATLEQRDLSAFLDSFRRIAEAPIGDADTERQKDAWYREMDENRDPYQQVANLWLAPYFGVEVTPKQFGRALEALRAGSGSEKWQDVCEEGWFEEAQRVAQEQRFFHWELEFPEAFFEASDGKARLKAEGERGFDAAIGNPPYEVLLVSEVGENLLDFVNARFESAEYNPNTYALFLERSLDWARAGGRVGKITLDSWITGSYFTNIRGLLGQCFTPTRVLTCGERAFPEVIGSTAVIVGLRTEEAKSVSLRVERLVRRWGISETTVSVDWRPLAARPGKPWNRLLFGGEWELRRTQRLSEVCTVYRGVETVDNDEYLSSVKRDARDREILTGVGMSRYYIPWDHTYVRFIPHELKSNADLRMYEVPSKILLRRTGSEVIAALDTSRRVALKNLYVILPGSQPPDARYVLSVINSRHTAFWHQEVMRNEGQVFAQLPGEHVSNFPVPQLDLSHATQPEKAKGLLHEARRALRQGEREATLALARKALATHAYHHGPAGKPELKEDEYWAKEIENADPDFPGREDFVHDLLAELAQRMIDLNEQKHDIIDRFNTDLRGLADDETAEKLEKGKQGRSLFKHEPCRDFVEEGSYSTHHIHEALNWSEDAFEVFLRELAGTVSNLSEFIDAYRNYGDDYTGVIDDLSATDNLIDRIVYALYGLSEEGIRIVDESIDE